MTNATADLSRGQKAAQTRHDNEAAAPTVDLIASNAQIATLVKAMVSADKADDKVRVAFIAAGPDQKNVINAYYAARMSIKLKVTYEAACIALGKANYPEKAPETATDKHRTKAEHDAYKAATVHLTARRKEWGIATTSTQGGARTPTAKPDVLDTDEVTLPKKVDIKTPPDFVAFMHALANTAYGVCLKNKDTAIVKSAMGSEVMGACADFQAAMLEIVAKFAPKA